MQPAAMAFHVPTTAANLTITGRMRRDACTEPTMICAWMSTIAQKIFARQPMNQQTAKDAPTKQLILAVTMAMPAPTISAHQVLLDRMQRTDVHTLLMTLCVDRKSTRLNSS